MAKDDEAPDWAKAEIAAAVEILKSDGLHIHKTYEQFMAGKDQPPTEPKSEDKDTEGQPPPVTDTPTETSKKKSFWWGDRT